MRCYIETDASCINRTKGINTPMRIGYIIKNFTGKTVAQAGLYVGEGTVNQAEYLAVIYALRHAARLGFSDVYLRVDSQLLVRQVTGQYATKNVRIRRLSRELRGLSRLFNSMDIQWTPREKNTDADDLTHRSVFEEPDVFVRARVAGNGGKHPRALQPWQAHRIRRCWDLNDIYPDLTEGVLCRAFRIDMTTLRQLLRGQTYQEANEDLAPNWNAWAGGLVTCSLDDGTGWPDREDLDDLTPSNPLVEET